MILCLCGEQVDETQEEFLCECGSVVWPIPEEPPEDFPVLRKSNSLYRYSDGAWEYYDECDGG
jgi:hypothetical protein